MKESSNAVAAITGSSHVFLVTDTAKSSEFYKLLGFKYEEIGGPEVKHIHLSRGGFTLIIHLAKDPKYIRPLTSLEEGPQWDAFVYTDYADLLFEELTAAGAPVAYGLNQAPFWNEFAIKDPDGYILAFGGGSAKSG